MSPANVATNITTAWNTLGHKSYELNNHLGNVLTTITDRRVQGGSEDGLNVDTYTADIATIQDYYAFGMEQPGRVGHMVYDPSTQTAGWQMGTGGYKYGFNGKENDNDIKGEGNQQDYGMRIYDPRVGRFYSVDPLTKSYPWYTPYQFAGNKPINSIDLDGAEEYESYEAYAKDKGSSALAKMDGSDGAWLYSDRISKSKVWSNAMAAITKNSWKDKFHQYAIQIYGEKSGTIQEVQFSFEVVRDYYNWAQNQMEGHNFKSRWALGASYLVDELAHDFDNGTLTSILYNKLGGLLKDLNQGIAGLAVDKFRSVLFEGKMDNVTSDVSWYKWDKQFISDEQLTIAAPPIYKRYAGSTALDELNSLSSKKFMSFAGWGSRLSSKHYFPNFGTFNISVNDPKTGFGASGRFNVPLLMLWPSLHQNEMKINLTEDQANQINTAHKEIMDYHKNSMKL